MSPILLARKLDMKKRFTEEQIIGFLGGVEAGLPIEELCRWHGSSEANYSMAQQVWREERARC